MAAQTDLLREALSRYKPDNMATLIDRLSGNKDNLRVDFRQVKFTLRNQEFEVNGMVDFKVIHQVSDIHVLLKEEASKYG
jgi:hypothetical protein